MRRPLGAGAPLNVLVQAAEQQRWAGLPRAERAVLRALCFRVNWRTGYGCLPVADVAVDAGFSPRWTGPVLARLEAAGLITWTRGYWDGHQAHASRFRVNKVALVDLLFGPVAARYLEALAELRRRARAATAARLAGKPPVRGVFAGQRMWKSLPTLTPSGGSPPPGGGGGGPGPHPFTPGEHGGCTDCPLPQRNRCHSL